jgi:hypothetical protein
MRIDEMVREAHLSHFCPGGSGVPVTSSRPIGLDEEQAVPERQTQDNAAHASGRPCGRCAAPITPGQDARRHVSGSWVHENCPA